MEGSESEAIFDSLNLNPQLFINEVLNSVDDLVDGAFHYFNHRLQKNQERTRQSALDFLQRWLQIRQASTVLKIEGTDRVDDLNKGVAYIRNMIQLVLDKRLTMWEKYCLRHCFVVPEGFSLPKDNESSDDNSMDLDAIDDSDLDVQLDSLREKLTLVGKESAGLNRELRALDRQSVLSNHCAGSVNEALQLYEQHSMHEMFQELIRTASEFRTKVEKLNIKRVEETERIRKEMMHTQNGDLLRRNRGNGLFNATLEELQEFMADLKTL